MKSIKFLGASGEVTGSGYLLTSDSGETLLVDLGMFQGDPELENFNYSPLGFNSQNLTGVVLTHAHLDHCGRLPLLFQDGYTGPIYTTQPTMDIIEISLMDSASIAMEDESGRVLYTRRDVQATMDLVKPVEYEKQFSIGSFNVVFRDAGHILGSASIEIWEGANTDTRVVFSGDLGNFPQELIKPTEFIARASTVVMESTYGDRSHPAQDPVEVIYKEIQEIISTDGTLLIPAFSIERAQELLHILSHLKESGRISPELPVYLDSPMAIDVTRIFKKYPRLYSIEMQHDASPFDFPGLVITDKPDESRQIAKDPGVKVIIAGSGMMSGGRIMRHLMRYVSDPANRILIVGYQAEGTTGREIENGATEITIDDNVYQVHASVNKIESLSSHADQPRLLTWLGKIEGVKIVYLVHGENASRAALLEKIREGLSIDNIVIPTDGQTLPVL